MRITVESNEQSLVITAVFMCGDAGDAKWRLSNQCSDKFYAGLAAQALRSQLHDLVANIRRESYEQGYNDGRGRKKRKDYFSGYLGD